MGRTCVATLSLHTADQSEEELLLSAELLEELKLSAGSFLEIRPQRKPEGEGEGASGAAGLGGNLILQVGHAHPPKGSHAVSLLAAAASLYNLASREAVELAAVPPAAAALEWVEMVFKDQYLSRGDIWYWMQQLMDESPNIFLSKTFEHCGSRVAVSGMARAGQAVGSGALGPHTRVSFRSRSATFFLLVQISTELWDTHEGSGELHVDRAMAFLSALFDKWKALGVSHNLTVVLFARCFTTQALPGAKPPEMTAVTTQALPHPAPHASHRAGLHNSAARNPAQCIPAAESGPSLDPNCMCAKGQAAPVSATPNSMNGTRQMASAVPSNELSCEARPLAGAITCTESMEAPTQIAVSGSPNRGAADGDGTKDYSSRLVSRPRGLGVQGSEGRGASIEENPPPVRERNLSTCQSQTLPSLSSSDALSRAALSFDGTSSGDGASSHGREDCAEAAASAIRPSPKAIPADLLPSGSLVASAMQIIPSALRQLTVDAGKTPRDTPPIDAGPQLRLRSRESSQLEPPTSHLLSRREVPPATPSVTPFSPPRPEFTGGARAAALNGLSENAAGDDTEGGRRDRRPGSSARDKGLMLDCAGRPHTDYYKLVVESESRQEWETLIEQMRTEIERFRQALRRRAAHSFHQKADRQRANSRQRRSTSPSYGRDPSSSRSDNHPACGIIARGDKSPEADGAIGDHGPGARDCSHDFAIPAHSLSDAATAFCGPEDASPLPLGLSNASEGNFLESINLALDVLECSYEELDLASTGKSVLVLTAGSGVFSVDQTLSAISKQRMIDNGIGCDLVCAGSPPLHMVPVFKYIQPQRPSAPHTDVAQASSHLSSTERTPGDHLHMHHLPSSSTMPWPPVAPRWTIPAQTPTAPPTSAAASDVPFVVPHWILTSFTDPPPPLPFPAARLTYAPDAGESTDTKIDEGGESLIVPLAMPRLPPLLGLPPRRTALAPPLKHPSREHGSSNVSCARGHKMPSPCETCTAAAPMATESQQSSRRSTISRCEEDAEESDPMFEAEDAGQAHVNLPGSNLEVESDPSERPAQCFADVDNEAEGLAHAPALATPTPVDALGPEKAPTSRSQRSDLHNMCMSQAPAPAPSHQRGVGFGFFNGRRVFGSTIYDAVDESSLRRAAVAHDSGVFGVRQRICRHARAHSLGGGLGGSSMGGLAGSLGSGLAGSLTDGQGGEGRLGMNVGGNSSPSRWFGSNGNLPRATGEETGSLVPASLPCGSPPPSRVPANQAKSLPSSPFPAPASGHGQPPYRPLGACVAIGGGSPSLACKGPQRDVDGDSPAPSPSPSASRSLAIPHRGSPGGVHTGGTTHGGACYRPWIDLSESGYSGSFGANLLGGSCGGSVASLGGSLGALACDHSSGSHSPSRPESPNPGSSSGGSSPRLYPRASFDCGLVGPGTVLGEPHPTGGRFTPAASPLLGASAGAGFPPGFALEPTPIVGNPGGGLIGNIAGSFGGGVLSDGASDLRSSLCAGLHSLLPSFPTVCAAPPLLPHTFAMRPNANQRNGDAEATAEVAPIEGGALSSTSGAQTSPCIPTQSCQSTALVTSSGGTASGAIPSLPPHMFPPAAGTPAAASASATVAQFVPVSRPTNPFSFRFPADARELKKMSETSYARRRWLHVRSSTAEYFAGALENPSDKGTARLNAGGVVAAAQTGSPDIVRLAPALRYVESRSSLRGSRRSGAIGGAPLRHFQPHFEHQWTSLSQPAILPLTMDCTTEQLQLMRRQHAGGNSSGGLSGGGLWTVAVPMQQEVESTIPYEKVMDAEELLYEMVCQRLEHDFQLIRASSLTSGAASSSLSLRHETSHFLALGAQVQQIHFVAEASRAPPHQRPTRWPDPPSKFTPKAGTAVNACCGPSNAASLATAAANGTGSVAANHDAPSSYDASQPPGFSEIKVTRHFVQPMPALERGPAIAYHYMCWGGHDSGFQHFFSRIQPAAHRIYPWNRVDYTVCGWSSDLDPDMRLRCKRFALLNFEKGQEDSLLRLLSAPPGTQRLLGAAMDKGSSNASGNRIGGASGASAGGAEETNSLPSPPSMYASKASVTGTHIAGGSSGGVAVSCCGGSCGNTDGWGTAIDTWPMPQDFEQRPPKTALDRQRFERFIERVSPRMPLSVDWEDHVDKACGPSAVGGSISKRSPKLTVGSTSGTAHQHDGGASVAGDAATGDTSRGQAGGTEHFLDATRVLDMTLPPDSSGSRRRRMFMQIAYDSKASATQAWHIELRWLMCQVQQVEEIVKHCTRRARIAGLLFLQIPTDRRPRPFTSRAIIAVPSALRSAAAAALCHHVGFVPECAADGNNKRWMHELGVAFVRPHSSGFTWLPNRLLPSQAARGHSDKLLARFREVCKALEFAHAGWIPKAPSVNASPAGGRASKASGSESNDMTPFTAKAPAGVQLAHQVHHPPMDVSKSVTTSSEEFVTAMAVRRCDHMGDGAHDANAHPAVDADSLSNRTLSSSSDNESILEEETASVSQTAQTPPATTTSEGTL